MHKRRIYNGEMMVRQQQQQEAQQIGQMKAESNIACDRNVRVRERVCSMCLALPDIYWQSVHF